MREQPLPPLHGDDHLPWGADPIPGLSLLKEITSDDGSVVVTNPFGPVADLSVVFRAAEMEILTTSVSLTAGALDTADSFTHLSGSTLFDLTDPTTPLFVADGAYICMWEGTYSSMTVDHGVATRFTLGLGRTITEEAGRYTTASERNRLHITSCVLGAATDSTTLHHANADTVTVTVDGSAVLLRLPS